AGASTGNFGHANDTMSVAGLVGFNVFAAGSVLLSPFWTPSWDQLAWMWGGLALGEAISLPVYIFYAGSKYDPRRGLIFQAVAGTLGIGAGALWGYPDKAGAVVKNELHPRFARLLGGSLMP